MLSDNIEVLTPKKQTKIQSIIADLNNCLGDIYPGSIFLFDENKKRIIFSETTNNGQINKCVPFVAKIKCDQIKDDKVNNRVDIYYQFEIVDANSNEKAITLNGESISRNSFIKAVRQAFPGFGPISDDINSLIYKLAVYSAHFRNMTIRDYCVEGLSLDNKEFVYRTTQIEIPPKDFNLEEEVKIRLRNTIIDLGSCCKDPAVIITLLLLSLVSLLYEAFLRMREDQRYKVIPTFLIFICGKSGSGKTTISKAIFNAHTSDRFISVPSTTPAAMQKAIKMASSGTLLFDDIPHKGYNHCSSEDKAKLEILIRSSGDMGSEKRTARSDESVTSPKRVMTAVTSEAPFFISDSSTLRCFYCPIEKGSIDLEKFGKYRDSVNALNEISVNFIKWAFSELIDIDENEISMPMLDTYYNKALEETQSKFTDVIEPRVFDNFIHLELYWQIFAVFLSRLGLSEEETAYMKNSFDEYLLKSARLQQELIKCNSAEEAVRFTLEKTVCSNRTVSYHRINNRLCSIETDSYEDSEGSAIGYYNGYYLIMTSEHQKTFLQNFYSIYSEKLKQRDIIELLYSMGLVVSPKDASTLLTRPQRTKIKINGKEKDVIILNYQSNFKEEIL